MQSQRMMSAPVFACLALILSLLGCAGFRGGWESVPYVGEPPVKAAIARTPFESGQRLVLNLPGINLWVQLRNRIRSYDNQVMLLVVPMKVDPRNVPADDIKPNVTRVTITVTPHIDGWHFDPRQTRLGIGPSRYPAQGVTRFAQWDSQQQVVSIGGQWRDMPVAESMTLVSGTSYVFNLEFAVTTPDPNTPALALDLSDALIPTTTTDNVERLPLIRFFPARWKHGYT